MSIVVRSNEKPATEAPAAKATGGEAASASKETTASAPAVEADQNETTESETAEKEGTEGEESEETETPESESEEETETEKEKPTGKKKGGFQRRIDKLNAAKSAAQQEAEYWKREAMKNATAQKEAPKVDSKQAPEGEPKPDDFETHAAYVRALIKHDNDQREKTRAAEAEKLRKQSDEQKAVTTYSERAKAFAEKQADFAEVLSEVDGIAISPAVRGIILESENGPELAYELAKNPDEFERICKLAPIAAAREMGKFEAKLASKASTESKPEPKKITKAPKPLAPVSSGKGSAAKSIDDPNLSQREYEKLRREQQKRRQA